MDNEEIGGCPLSLNIVPGMPCLGASTFNESALASVVAGQMCTVLLHACNPFGTRLSSGGARLTAALSIDGAPDVKHHATCIDMRIGLWHTIATFMCNTCHFRRSSHTGHHEATDSCIYGDSMCLTSDAGGWHAAEVADREDGSYAVSLKPEKAGSFQLVLSIEGVPKPSAQKRAYTGVCIAGATAAEQCGLSGSMTQLVAGQPGKLTLTRADRCGEKPLMGHIGRLGNLTAL